MSLPCKRTRHASSFWSELCLKLQRFHLVSINTSIIVQCTFGITWNWTLGKDRFDNIEIFGSGHFWFAMFACNFIFSFVRHWVICFRDWKWWLVWFWKWLEWLIKFCGVYGWCCVCFYSFELGFAFEDLYCAYLCSCFQLSKRSVMILALMFVWWSHTYCVFHFLIKRGSRMFLHWTGYGC